MFHPPKEKLSLWQGGALSPEEVEPLTTHIDGCDQCRLFVAGEARLTTLLRTNPSLEIPAGLVDQISSVSLAEYDRHQRAEPDTSVMMNLLLASLAATTAVVMTLAPHVGNDPGGWLSLLSLQIKDGLLLMRSLRPVLGALVVLAEQIYVPLLVGAAATTLGLGWLASRMMGDVPLHRAEHV